MQLARTAFIVFAASVLLATPTLAGNSRTQKAETEDTTPSCHSYKFGADGHWTELPCQELGTHSSSQQRTAPKPHDEQAH